jgi:class 3 adenylate cyclase
MPESGTVTFLFSDLVDSTRHLQEAGDEAGQKLFRAHHKLMSDAVVASGGQELEWLGDGMLVVFSSTADAIRCAVSIQQSARRPVSGRRLDIRIGIHLGEALRREGGYFGLPVVIARRLCDRASTGQILCSRLVAEILSGRHTFSFREIGAFELKGIATPMGVCEVVYERNDPAAMLNRTPFVGRGAQLERLSARLADASAGRGSVVMLRGEAGIGKSRMLEEFADHARQRGAIVMRGACYDGDWRPSFGPLAEAIVDYSRRAPGEFAAAVGKRGRVIARIAPGLESDDHAAPEPLSVDKEEERFRLFDAVAQFLIAVSQRAPLVLVLDDLHWADRSTVALLSHVAHFVTTESILLIGAYRDGEVDRKHPLSAALASLSRMRNFESLTLKGLEGPELADLLEMIADHNAPDQLVKAIGEATDGNPLFIREVLLHLLEEGKILRDGQGWTSRFSVDQLDLPEGVRQVIGQRLMRLSEEANRLLAVGAAFNGAFSFDVAASVAELEESAALSAIDEALDAQLVRPGANPETFDFTHAMVRHTLYAELNPPRRARLHRKIAEEMERAWGERAEEHAAEVAYQFWRGAKLAGAERGTDYAIAAANNAEAVCAHDEVVAFLRIAIELLPRSDSRRARLMARLALTLPWTLSHEDGLQVAREAGELIKETEGLEAAADYLEQAAREMHSAGRVRTAWELARDGLRYAGDRRDLTWASLSELDLVRADAEDPDNAGILTDSPKRREVRDVLKCLSSEQLRSRGIDPPFASRAEIVRNEHASPFALVLMAGEFRRGLALWQDEAAAAERQGRIASAMTAWSGVAGCHAALGDFTLVEAALDRAMALRARSTGPGFQAPSLFLNGVKYQLLLAIDDGWDALSREADNNLLIKKPAPENNWSFALVRAVSAFVMARLGRTDLCLQRLASLPRAFETGALWESSYGPMACDAAAALWLLNRTDYSEFFEKALREKVIAPDFRFPMRDSRLSLARICALQGRYDEAVEWFGAARAVLDEQGARPLRAITDFDEGLMYVRRGAVGDTQLARPYLCAADDQFGALGMTGWSRRVRGNLEPAAKSL